MKEVRGGLGITRRRRAVLDAVRESRRHLSASEIWERARAREPKISFATVYNAVHYLCDAGLLVSIPFGDGASLYDARTERHDHALCTGCGRMVDFYCDIAPQVAAQGARATGFEVTEARVVLSGLCPECRERAASTEQPALAAAE